MCPRKHIFQTDEILTKENIKKIIVDIKQAIKKKLVNPKFFLVFSLFCEPLLDNEFIEKLNLFHDNLDCQIRIYTNGVFLHKYKDRLSKCRFIKELVVSNYGNTIDKFEHISQVKLKKEVFDNMKKAVNEIKKKINVRVWNAWQNGKICENFSKRAGLVGKVKVKQKIKGCDWKRLNDLYILSNGDMILCCQDWKRETKYGNILQDKLHTILNSKRYKDLIDKVHGKESDYLFICKRCKYGIGE
jgi:radical SAM protein with 4Fe4S-binding SPASM domain